MNRPLTSAEIIKSLQLTKSSICRGITKLLKEQAIESVWIDREHAIEFTGNSNLKRRIQLFFRINLDHPFLDKVSEYD